jgi:hypothetical protein
MTEKSKMTPEDAFRALGLAVHEATADKLESFFSGLPVVPDLVAETVDVVFSEVRAAAFGETLPPARALVMNGIPGTPAVVDVLAERCAAKISATYIYERGLAAIEAQLGRH